MILPGFLRFVFFIAGHAEGVGLRPNRHIATTYKKCNGARAVAVTCGMVRRIRDRLVLPGYR